MQKSLFSKKDIPITPQNKKITLKAGKEFCAKTGKRVYRTKQGRPYILETDTCEGVNYFDIAIVYLAFLRRIVQDASGDELFDNTLSQAEKDDTREYLLNGTLTRNGYTQFEYEKINKRKRLHEKRMTKFIKTKEQYSSRITLNDICEYMERDIFKMNDLINDWKSKGWSQDHPFYTGVMEATRGVASE